MVEVVVVEVVVVVVVVVFPTVTSTESSPHQGTCGSIVRVVQSEVEDVGSHRQGHVKHFERAKDQTTPSERTG